jgi:transcriptional regulator with XRE-family HTH domain
MSIGSRLSEARKRAGLSARALDKKAGITPGHTTLIEQGERAKPSAEIVHKLAVALGVPMGWLVAGEAGESGEMPSADVPPRSDTG